MLVYRVELKCSLLCRAYGRITQHGPYGNTYAFIERRENPEWFYENRIDTNPCLSLSEFRHPSVRQDPLLRQNQKMYENGVFEIPENGLFCFSSVEDLLTWFDIEARGTLKSAGFICVAYEAGIVYNGVNQSIFLRETATPVDFIDLFEVQRWIK